MSKLKFTLGEVITIITIVLSVMGAWYDLKSDVRYLQHDIRVVKGQMQWVLGEAIKSGWIPPNKTIWVIPEE